MKQILKNPSEPVSLTKYRSKSSIYNDYQPKDDLREQLVQEQGHICCYCMSRIAKEKMIIEHFKPRDKYPNLQLDYQNILGSCLGEKGKPKHLHHCDLKKDNKEITLNPASLAVNCEELIQYSDNGKISSSMAKIDTELNDILNLNSQSLVDKRKGILTALENTLKNNSISLEQMLNNLKTKSDESKYQPYCQVGISYIQKKISKYK
jgi:uncharacterized protein (TIGR02646 family)